MSYRIEYDSFGNAKRYTGKKRTLPKEVLIGIGSVLVIAILLYTGLWQQLRSFFMPDVSEMAFTVLVEELRSGESVSDAVTAFCEEVIENADISE